MREVRRARAREEYVGFKVKTSGVRVWYESMRDRSTEIEVQRDILGILQIAEPLFASIPDSLATKCACGIVKCNKFQEFIKDN